MAAVRYYVRREGKVLEVCKSVEVVGYKAKWTSNVWLHESRDGSWKAYKDSHTNEQNIEQIFDGVVKVIGDTYEVRSLLKSLGFTWNPSEKAWVRPENTDQEEAKESEETTDQEEAKALVEAFAKELRNHGGELAFGNFEARLIEYMPVIGSTKNDPSYLKFEIEWKYDDQHGIAKYSNPESIACFVQVIKKIANQ